MPTAEQTIREALIDTSAGELTAKELIFRGCMAAAWWDGAEAELVARVLTEELTKRQFIREL